MATISETLAKTIATSYKGFFRYYAKLAEGITVGDSLLPIKIILDTEGAATYMGATDDQAIMLRLLKARNVKRIRLAIDTKESGTEFVSDLYRLADAKVPFMVAIAVGRYAYGKRSALYVLRDSSAQLLDGWPPNIIKDQNSAFVSLSLPSAHLEQGHGEGFNLKKIK
jgi:hypothetical protein